MPEMTESQWQDAFNRKVKELGGFREWRTKNPQVTGNLQEKWQTDNLKEQQKWLEENPRPIRRTHVNVNVATGQREETTSPTQKKPSISSIRDRDDKEVGKAFQQIINPAVMDPIQGDMIMAPQDGQWRKLSIGSNFSLLSILRKIPTWARIASGLTITEVSPGVIEISWRGFGFYFQSVLQATKRNLNISFPGSITTEYSNTSPFTDTHNYTIRVNQTSALAGEAISFGDILYGNPSDGRVYKASRDTISKMNPYIVSFSGPHSIGALLYVHTGHGVSVKLEATAGIDKGTPCYLGLAGKATPIVPTSGAVVVLGKFTRTPFTLLPFPGFDFSHVIFSPQIPILLQ